jgi:hypothetical protein
MVLGPPVLEKCVRTGTLVEQDGEGYWLVRLEQPVRYDNQVSPPEMLTEIWWAEDNMELVDAD